MILTIALLIVSLGVILLAADLFTNSIEWTGHKLQFNEGVVGSILAAVGTALPETTIPFVAVFFATDPHAGKEVGLGAILGAPFMLATLALFVTGLAVLVFQRQGRRNGTMRVNSQVLGRDIRFFLIAYTVALVAAFLPWELLKRAIAVAALLLYVFYVYKHATDKGAPGDMANISPLHFARNAVDPPFPMVVLQVLAGLGLMVGGAYFFVEMVTEVATILGVPALVLSLVIAPIATELPEKFNSIIWVRKGKDTLALGNITGAMVFQSCIPVTFGVLFTQWTITAESTRGFASAAVAIASATIIFGTMQIRGQLTARLLLVGGLGYVVYLSYLLLGL